MGVYTTSVPPPPIGHEWVMRSHLPQRLLDEELEPEARSSAILNKFLMSIMHAQRGTRISDNGQPQNLQREMFTCTLVKC